MKDLNTTIFKNYLDKNTLESYCNPSLFIEPRKQANRLYNLFCKDLYLLIL